MFCPYSDKRKPKLVGNRNAKMAAMPAGWVTNKRVELIFRRLKSNQSKLCAVVVVVERSVSGFRNVT